MKLTTQRQQRQHDKKLQEKAKTLALKAARQAKRLAVTA